MCISQPKMQTAPASPVTDTSNETNTRESTRQSDLLRRRRALSKTKTQGAGAMQGSLAGGGKGLLGQ